LIIGGGAAASPRVKRLCGEKDACHLFRGNKPKKKAL